MFQSPRPSRRLLLLPLIVLALASTAPEAAQANGTHRECEDASTGRHRHTSTGERVLCAPDALQNPETRDQPNSTDHGGASTREAPSADPGRDGLSPGATRLPSARTLPNREHGPARDGNHRRN